jgi:beta-N-acetylhexosaminidase
MTQDTEDAQARLTMEQAVGQMMLVAFPGYELPAQFTDLLQRRQIGGVTLFRSLNVRDPQQVRELTASIQRAAVASGQPPLLIGADQEGGQLLALAGATPFSGNMALGATRSPELARRVGLAIGREMAAMGINVNYAPVCDVNINPRNPVVGTRSFGEDPASVGQLAAAMVEGLQEAGVAATPKHFPGHGDSATDSHYSMPVLPFDEERLRRVELPPFAAAVRAGAKLVMTAHIALPALTGGLEVPATLSRPILHGLLRDDLGFQGVIVSDAMDMHAIEQGPGLVVDSLAAAAAGVDLLMLTDIGSIFETVYAALLQAARRGLLPPEEIEASARRVLDLKAWVSEHEQPGLDVVQCEDHRSLAYELASRSVTLVRDTAGILPLRLSPNERIAVVLPRPENLTPADTSSYESPVLADELRRYHPNVDQIDYMLNPAASEVASVVQQASGYDLVVIGTINAPQHPGQAELVNALLQAETSLIAVALRLPYDITTYPGAPTYICTYSIQPPSMQALADALWGHAPFEGQLPVTVQGI